MFLSRLYPAAAILSSFVLATPLFAQTAPAAQATLLARPQTRITAKVDNTQRVTLKGNVHPLARPAYDHGKVDDSTPMKRMILVLSHSDAQEQALDQLLNEQQDKSSPMFHQWLTPEQYGAEFGASDADIATITAWLTSQGFTVGKVANGRNSIEFSGTAAQVTAAFQTPIDKYVIKGVAYQANSQDPSIPAALAPVVRGILSLHDFPRKPLHSIVGSGQLNVKTGKVTKTSDVMQLTQNTTPVSGAAALPSPDKPGAQPLFTYPYSTSITLYAITPYDLATIYNELPLWNAGIDGTGETVAILQETNIHLDDVRAFRSILGLPAKDPVVILNGPDPGVTAYDEGEADIDVEWAGATAKGATIDLIVSASTATTQGIDLSALYAVDNNVAPITSLSYGGCEFENGAAGNAFYDQLWQQGASQGMSHFVSTGDSGSDSCDDNATTAAEDGLSVSGLASTPYDTAVGGTDFLGALVSPSTFFNSTNNPTTLQSALSYVPETAWNNTCTQVAYELSTYNDYASPAAACQGLKADGLYEVGEGGGSGGQSNCINGNGSSLTSCTQGYAKPSWQTGLGVPADGVRDLPDVSLFAANGGFDALLIYCEEDANADGQSCNFNSPYADFGLAGGTSFASPMFAGMMALVDQKTNARQGVANYVLYDLFNQQVAAGTACNGSYAYTGTGPYVLGAFTQPASSCVFNDVTFGSNGNACAKGSTDCTVTGSNTYGILTTPSTDTPASTEGFLNTPGYDLANGLGSVNLNNLVNDWANVTFVPTTTTLSLSSTTFAHGTPVNATVGVTPSSGSQGSPSGNAELLTSTTPASLGYVALTANPGGTGSSVVGSYSDLPGGTYTVSAQYSGDGTYASSTSSPVAVTVTPENSTLTGLVQLENESTGALSTVSTCTYGAQCYIEFTPAAASGQGTPTGTVTVYNNGASFVAAPLAGGSVQISTTGAYEAVGAGTLPPGTYSFTGAYSGDSSFNASSTTAATPLTITQSGTTTTLKVGTRNPAAGASETLTATVVSSTSLANGDDFGAFATGTVTFYSGGTSGTNLGTVSFNSATYNTSTDAPESVATLVTTGLPYSTAASSTDSITAVYSGDTNYLASTSSATSETVAEGTKTATTNTLTATNLPLTYGTSTMLTSTLTYSGATVPTGNVSFYVDGVISGTAVALNGSAQASETIAALPGGFHTITAVYATGTTFLGSTGTLTTTVTPDATALALTGSASSANQGVPLTFTATIPYTTPAEPSGLITFTVDGVASGPGIAPAEFITGGVGATFNTGTLAPGMHTIGAVYSGDKNYAGSGNSVSVSIIAAPTLLLTVNQRTAVVLGAPVTIGVQANSMAGGPIPTGSISYSVDGGASTVVALVNGAASFTLSGLNEMQHTITVVYSGDGTYTSVSQTLVLNGDVAQTILFPGLANATFAATPNIALTARSTSGLPVTYTVSGPATVNGPILTLTGTGTVTVTASQAGNSSFAAAKPVTTSFLSQ